MMRSIELGQQLAESDFGVVVLDDFLPEDDFTEVRQHLINHWGWRYKNWANGYLHNYHIDAPALDRMAELMSGPLSEAAGRPVSRQAQWAILAHRDDGLKPHADNGTYVVNFWLTPDEYNLTPGSGGVVFYDVRRPETTMSPEFQVSPQSDEYVSTRTAGRKLEIPYRCNRAAVFDATIFHASAPISFANEGAHSKRLNVSMVFDDPDLFDMRRERGLTEYEAGEPK